MDDVIVIDSDMPEFDTLEQHRPVSYRPPDVLPTEVPIGVPEADLLDQSRQAPLDDEPPIADD
jgi:hypothetical protein